MVPAVAVLGTFGTRPPLQSFRCHIRQLEGKMSHTVPKWVGSSSVALDMSFQHELALAAHDSLHSGERMGIFWGQILQGSFFALQPGLLKMCAEGQVCLST